jgi:hypothetical protein
MTINMDGRALLLGAALALVALSSLAAGSAFLVVGTDSDHFRTAICGSGSASEVAGEQARGRHDEN